MTVFLDTVGLLALWNESDQWHALSQPRPLGLAKGQFTVPDDFIAPLPEDMISGLQLHHESETLNT